MNRVRLTTLLIADKGRKAGQFAVPPVQDDGAGYPFAVAPNGRIALCNDSNLILMDPNRRKTRLLKAPLGEQTEFWGIACSNDLLVALLSDYTIALMDWEGRVRQRFGNGFGKGENQISDAPPVRMAIAPLATPLWMQADSLYRISVSDGRIERVITAERGKRLTGLAVDASGRVYLSSEEPIASTEPLQWQKTPERLKPLSPEVAQWHLFGIDQAGNFYWHGERLEKRQKYLITEVACVAPEGSVRWHLALNGALGVLQPLRSASQIQWLEVDRQGRLYALGWVYAGLRQSVRLFRVEIR
ncbi:hypothetical protein GBSOP10_10874 [Armatimonadetes bacterium GBS]|jgi:hypothetical protein|nr:hypothetical protein GBSOP10_10874 [Armatimonadetes bacterium GBS]CUU34649.1 hypothetical protein GXSOP10_1175 [Armatimonadetes bacterium GXS]